MLQSVSAINSRYSRQIQLLDFGIEGQACLRDSKVLCVGMGGLGSPISLYLAAAGVGTLGLMDGDRVDVSNLQRQILYYSADQGELKAVAAKKRLEALNPENHYNTHAEWLTDKNALQIFKNYDLIIDGTDDFSSKYLINDAAIKAGVPLVYGAIQQFEGYTGIFYGAKGSCYRCLYPDSPKADVKNCNETGIIGGIAGVIGSLQATLAIRWLISKDKSGHPLAPSLGQVSVFDLGSMESHSFWVPKRKGCICEKDPTEINLKYESRSCFVASQIEIEDFIKKERKSLYLIIDVREKTEWDAGFIPDAIHCPLDEIESKIENFYKNKKFSAVLFYCKSGVRSQKAVAKISQKTKIPMYSLRGGYDAWKEKSGQLQTKDGHN